WAGVRRIAAIDQERVVLRTAVRAAAHHVDARERIPACDVAGHAVREIVRLERPRPRRRQQLTPEGEDHDETYRGRDGRDSAQPRAECRRRGERDRSDKTECARESVQGLVSEASDREVSDQSADGGAREVECVDRPACGWGLPQRSDDDPAREQYRRNSEEVGDGGRGERSYDQWVDLLFHPERGKQAEG